MKKILNIAVLSNLYERLLCYANSRGRSVTEVVRCAIEDYLEKADK